MAAGTSIFLPVMEYNGDTWHLQYDPENPMSVRPDLVGGKITNMSCAPVKLPRQHPDKQFYMVVVSILMPASMEPSGRAIPEKRLLGFRVYDYLPAKPSTLDALNLNEMVFYIAEPRPGSDAQTLLETVLGLKVQEQPAAEAVNTDWTKMLMQQDAPEPQPEPVAPQQRAYTAPQQHTMQLSDGTVR